MIKISKSEMAKKLRSLADEGLTNAEMAARLNEEHNIDGKSRVTAAHIAKFKAATGLSNLKPKKKSAFLLVDDEEVEAVVETSVVEETPIVEVAEYAEVIEDEFGAYVDVTPESTPQQSTNQFSF